MTAELTAEEIVTNLLSSHQILGANQKLSISSPLDLGAYLNNLPEEVDCINDKSTTHSSSHILKEVDNNSKYTFIKDGMWHF